MGRNFQLYLHNVRFLMNVSRDIIYRSVIGDNIEYIVEGVIKLLILINT